MAFSTAAMDFLRLISKADGHLRKHGKVRGVLLDRHRYNLCIFHQVPPKKYEQTEIENGAIKLPFSSPAFMRSRRMFLSSVSGRVFLRGTAVSRYTSSGLSCFVYDIPGKWCTDADIIVGRDLYIRSIMTDSEWNEVLWLRFSLYRKLCNLFNGFRGKFQFNAIRLKQLLILLGQGILRLGQDPA